MTHLHQTGYQSVESFGIYQFFFNLGEIVAIQDHFGHSGFKNSSHFSNILRNLEPVDQSSYFLPLDYAASVMLV